MLVIYYNETPLMQPPFDHKVLVASTRSSKQLNDSVIFTFRQRAKKVVSYSPGLVDFVFRLVNSVLNLPDGQVNFFGKFKLQNDCNQSC